MRALLVAALLTSGSAFADDLSAWEQEVLDNIKLSLPQVVSAVWPHSGVLWLGVIDNGQNRDGLATAACGSIQYYKTNPKNGTVIIRIVDVAKAAFTEDYDALGYAECPLE